MTSEYSSSDNTNRPVMYVLYRQMRRASKDSFPECCRCSEGVLLPGPHHRAASCCACGQRYHYMEE